MSIDAMKLALEALRDYHKSDDDRLSVAMSILRLAIEQAEKQEPVGQILVGSDGRVVDAVRKPSKLAPGFHDVYTAPPQRQPLTERELQGYFLRTNTAEPLAEGWPGLERFARAIERAHGIGGDE